MTELAQAVDECARADSFSGVVRVDQGESCLLEAAYGLADRAEGRPMSVGTRFAIASGSKGFTAAIVHSLVEQGALSLATTARVVLGRDLPLIDDAVTVEQLLSHRSGIGDYLDEEVLETDSYVMPGGIHQYVTTGDYLVALDGHPQVAPPGTMFTYNNGAYVVLAIIAERVSGASYANLIRDRVALPAGMAATGIERTDEPAADMAVGYLWPDRPRTNVLHLPVLASGDGGAYTTAADLHRFWLALATGEIVSEQSLARMTTPVTPGPDEGGYGLGLWLPPEGGWQLHGADAGCSMLTRHDPADMLTWTVLSNDSDGAWPMVRAVAEALRLRRSDTRTVPTP